MMKSVNAANPVTGLADLNHDDLNHWF